MVVTWNATNALISPFLFFLFLRLYHPMWSLRFAVQFYVKHSNKKWWRKRSRHLPVWERRQCLLSNSGFGIVVELSPVALYTTLAEPISEGSLRTPSLTSAPPTPDPSGVRDTKVGVLWGWRGPTANSSYREPPETWLGPGPPQKLLI